MSTSQTTSQTISQAIKLENITKEYEILKRSQSIVDFIIKNYALLFQKNEQNSTKKILAIDTISLNVNQGEVLGIVGKNGTGKSTLGKIIGGLIQPTTGKITTTGSVLYLSGHGGFLQKKLTGRENALMIGILNGLSKTEIEKRIAQILELSGLESHFDLPVYTYSKGMVSRLLFSASIYTLPQEIDILILDEVFSSGADFEFSKKALDVVEEYIKNAKTIIMISHNMGLLKKYCTSCILLEGGKISMQDEPKKVIDFYLKL
jgi:lipopolysaccharide transport system ATP-binding protein